MRRYSIAGVISTARAAIALDDLRALSATRYAHAPLLPMIWQLRNLTAYDAAYVALAIALDAPLVTLDARLARSPAHRATVDLIE